jgi:hypothetical protein
MFNIRRFKYLEWYNSEVMDWEKDLVGNDPGLINLLLRHFPVGPEENH